MLDLARPEGVIEGLSIHGDHERADLFYYLPDTIALGTDGERAELALQIYYPDEAITGGVEDLAASVGGLLTLGVTCAVDSARLERVVAALCDRKGLEQVTLAIPPWEDGKVDLLLLDTTTAQPATVGTAAMVADIVGSRQPSLQDGRLTGLFHARLDRRGTALVDAALRGGLGTVAGVMYDLSYAALRPSLAMRITADLDECADFVRASLGVQTAYVGVQLGFVFDKMVQDGVIHVEVLSQLDSEEAQRAADEVVKDFQDTVMRELFRPMVPPLGSLLAAAGGSGQGSLVQLGATWGHSDHHRSIEIDYSKRQACRRRHNPQAHLHGLAAAAAAPERFIVRVPLGAAWREMAVEIAAPQAFDDRHLRELSVVLWRARDPVLAPADAREGGLRLPADVVALTELGFTADQRAPRKVAWVADPDEVPGYHWQVRAGWADDEAVDSPPMAWSEPRTSRSHDLDLFPALLFPTRIVQLELAPVLPPEIALVEVGLVARGGDARELARRTLSLVPGDPARSARGWSVRRAGGDELTLELATTFHFTDGRRLALPGRRVIDRDVTIGSPFVATRVIGVAVAGADAALDRVEVTLRYRDEASGYQHEVVRVLAAPTFRADDVVVPVLTAQAEVTWAAERLDRDGTRTRLGAGVATRSLLIPAQGEARVVRLVWAGPAALADADLNRVTVDVRVRGEAGEELERRSSLYRGTVEAEPRTLALTARGGVLEYSLRRRWLDGHEEATPFVRVEAGEVVITP